MHPLSWNALQPFGGLPSDVQVHVGFSQHSGGLSLGWRVEGDLDLVQWETQAGQENLWEQTCFEAFFQTTEHPMYYELNVSPEKEWKLYQLTGYRTGRRSVSEIPLSLHVERTRTLFHLQVDLLGNWPSIQRNALTAILYLQESPTYWAHTHAPERPDFHAHFSEPLLEASQ